jgi:hypothetical protein
VSNRGLITKAWLTSFGDFLTVLLCLVVASQGATQSGLTTRNHAGKSGSNAQQSIISGAGTTVASSKELAVLRAGFFDNAESSREVHDQLISVAKALPIDTRIDIELCAATSEAILQRAEILQGIFAKQKIRVYGTHSCSNLSRGEFPADAVAHLRLV